MIANGDESVPVISTSNAKGMARNETSPNKGEKINIIPVLNIY